MGKGVMLKGKNKENIYPVTSSDLVYDPITKKNIKEDLGGKVEEAPMDDKQYARINGAWAEVEAGAVSEVALISLTPSVSDLNGVSVNVTTNEGETLLDTIWQGSILSVQVRAGLQYTVAVGDKEGYITPESVTYTALKGVTRTIGMAYTESRLTVGILSNQENDAVISAVKATVAYGSTSVEVGNGETISLPLNVAVTITFPDVDGYKTPDAITYTHTSGSYTKNGTYQTELVRVTLSADNDASVSGQVVTINGVQHTYGSTAVEQKVPFGQYYNVSVSDMEGFTTPSVGGPYLASQSERNLELVYAVIPYGTYIQGISGKLYTAEEWNSQETANGLALYTDKCKLLIPMEQFITNLYAEVPLCEEGQANINPYSTIYSTKAEALSDFEGAAHTDSMISAYGSSSSIAANLCKNYILPNGKQNCYLPAAGELNQILSNCTKLDKLLLLCHNAKVRDSYVWSSSRAKNDEYTSSNPLQFWNIYRLEDEASSWYQYNPLLPNQIIVVAPLEI